MKYYVEYKCSHHDFYMKWSNSTAFDDCVINARYLQNSSAHIRNFQHARVKLGNKILFYVNADGDILLKG